MRIKVLCLIFTLWTGFFVIQPGLAESTGQIKNPQQSVVLDMQNMTCAMCGITIRKSLEAVDGVKTVKVDSNSETANVTFDPQRTTIDALIQATTNIGYPSTVHLEK